MTTPAPAGNMQPDFGDPLDWTVDELVGFLCHNPETPWALSATKASRPDPAILEPALRENEVNGEVFLQDVDKDELRNDLGLKALGHRSSMLMAIRYLRGRSSKFQAIKPQPSPYEERGPWSMSPYTTQRAPTHFSPAPPNYLRGPTIKPQPYSTPYSPIPPTQDDLNSALQASHRFSQIEENVARVSTPTPGRTTLEDDFHTPEEHPSQNPGISTIRSREQAVVDERGRKRRRLNLAASAETHRSPSHKKANAKLWYMGPERLSCSDIFYPSSNDGNASEDDGSFIITRSQVPPARRSIVNKRLSYLYRQEPVKLNASKGFSQWAVVPYKISDLPKGSTKIFTLYTSNHGQVTVSNENLENWPQLAKSFDKSKSTQDPKDPFSYLLEKYPANEKDEDPFPLYGDSGSEGEFDEETWEEIQEERRSKFLQQTNNLTSAYVESIIKDCIRAYEVDWNQNHRPREEHKAARLWLTAKRTKSTNQKIMQSNRDIPLLEKRLKQLHNAILDNEYTSKSDVQKVCAGMEQTVMDLQKQKWRIAVLEKDECPKRVPVPPRLAKQKKPKDVAGDEESLGSESDDLLSDSLSEFIDDSEDLPAGPLSLGKITEPSESDDDIISPSGKRRKSKKARPPFIDFSSSPSRSASPPPPVKEAMDLIDLTADSPTAEDFRIETPPLNPVGPTGNIPSMPLEDPFKIERSPSPGPAPASNLPSSIPPPRNSRVLPNQSPFKRSPSRLPDINDSEELLRVPWDLLEERQDRRRLLAKLIASLPGKERTRLAKRIPGYNQRDLKNFTRRAISALLDRKDKIEGLSNSLNQLVMRTASFFISWVNCVRLQLKGILKEHILKAQDEITEFRNFFNELCTRLSGYVTPDDPPPSEEAQPDLTDTPHKKRKREVKESQAAKREQESGQRRAALQSKQRSRFEEKMGLMGLSNNDPTRQAVSFGTPVIYLDPEIGKHVKPHQLGGIQFMWRELIEDENGQGCLLAHTMGLGKTMQVISLLSTISAAAASDDPRIRQQVPEAFHKSQTLILCPSSLIENWYDEFLMWTPEKSRIGTIRRVTTANTLEERLYEISAWNNQGGVLIISYDLFRALVLNRETNKRPKALSDAVHSQVTDCLLQGPNIIVADEAHKMKNPTSKLSEAAMQFRSNSRIALTGSPLANNLVDYYTMVNWIAKGYLGDFIQFKANFIEPIQDGLYVDSTHTERRRSLVKLQVLKEILDPKINRADISVLQGDLPTKTEFILTIPLTKLQGDAYNCYVVNTLQGAMGDDSLVGNAKLWSWLAILQLCCSHPFCFREKLRDRSENAKLAAQSLPGDEPITQAGIPNSDRLIAEQEDLFSGVPDISALHLSYRTLLLEQIIERSVRAGDKVLVFSHSIPILDYIEMVLKSSHRTYSRLDGSTPVVTRQAATKTFNSNNELEVYLISTRAGGLGLNIPGANRVIIFDFSFSPIWEEQAIGRAYRLGQKKQVYVYRFIAGGTFEEVMHNKALFKTQLAHRVVDKRNPIRQASKSLGEYLFPAKPIPTADLSEFIGKDPFVLDEIIKADIGEEKVIRKITLTETFQKDDNDKLTEEERQGVRQQLSDERLKRSDPEAYQKLIIERQNQMLASQGHPQYMGTPHWSATTPLMAPQASQAIQPAPALPVAPQNIQHNVGPPPLPPDMSMHQPVQRLPSEPLNDGGPGPGQYDGAPSAPAEVGGGDSDAEQEPRKQVSGGCEQQ